MKILRIAIINLFITISLIFIAEPAFGQSQYFSNDRWSGKFHREDFARIVDGEYNAVITDLEQFVRQHPNDAEGMYCLAVAHAAVGHNGEAASYVRQALGSGLPASRFLAGPRDVLKPLLDIDEVRILLESESRNLVHGPVLGTVTGNSARIWVRTAEKSEVQVLYSTEMDMSDAKKATAATDPDDDFTGIVQLRRLKPNTDYHYRISVDGWMSPAQWKFTTYAEQHEPTVFTVGFGGGSSFHPLNERIWKVLSTHNLSAFLTLGDNVYIDHPSRPAVQQYSYYRRQSSPFYRIFSSEVPFYAIWDDHDFGTNDSWGGPETFEPAWKVKVWEIFKQNWNNPSYGGGEEQPGVWFDYYIGDVHFIMLDGRYYRTDPKADDASLLGPAQIQWLQKTLKNSRGTFKVLASPVPWASGAKGGTQMTPQGRQPGGLDTWDGFPEERSAIYDFLHENKIEGVVLISADRHRSDLWRIDRENGYPLYEFESSRLTNIHVHSIMEGSIFGYNEKQSFGTIEFNTTLENPAVTYRIYSIDNEFIHEFTVSKDDLSY